MTAAQDAPSSDAVQSDAARRDAVQPAPRRVPDLLAGAHPAVTSIWRAAWVVVAVVVLCYVLWFVLSEGSSIVYYLVMSFFIALAMEPAVGRLSTRMPRSAATGLVMAGVFAGIALFLALFGGLLVDQLAQLVEALPGVTESIMEWVNTRFGTTYSTATILDDLGVSTEDLTGYAQEVAGGLLGLVGGLVSGFFGAFALAFFTFFLSSGLPRLREWTASLLPPRQQVPYLTAWDIIKTKVGGYVASRLTLAVFSSFASGVFMLIVGMPYWLPLALWTGVVSQFIPNVGTYIAIALPVLVGLTSDNPMLGLWVFIFALTYQQVENIGLEPRISARAVNVHEAVSFGAALLGAQLFGISGAALGVPVAATLVALLEIYKQRYEVTAQTEDDVALLLRRGGADGDLAEVEVPAVAADRLESGDLVLHAPTSEDAPTPTPPEGRAGD